MRMEKKERVKIIASYYSGPNEFERFRGEGSFGIDQQIRIRFSSLQKIFFLDASNSWCVQSSLTHNVAVHVPVLWPVCAHTIPLRMLWCS